MENKSAKKKGRRNKYESHVEPFLKKVEELAKTLNDAQIANELGVAPSSFENYKSQHEELRDTLRKGRIDAKKVKIEKYKSLLEKRAEGFTYKEVKKVIRSVDGVKTQVVEEYEKYSPPDVGALHLLLKNLDDDWTNDDKRTLDLKKEKLELEKMRLELNNW